jgi:paraquat-inducible protein A
MNRYILLFLHTASLVLLFFGWTLDMLQIDVSAEFIVSISLFNEKRSVIGTLQSLFDSANYFPFFLIFLFGIIVPVVKSTAIYYLLIAKNASGRWYSFVKAISKWAMADVYAISIFVAFLGARSMQNTKAALLPGFYYFAAYVLVSAVIAVLMGKFMAKPAANNA